MTPATLFYNPLILPIDWTLWMVIPVCVTVAVIYRTVRAPHLQGLVWEIAKLVAYLVGGLAGVSAVIWLVMRLVVGH